MKETEVIFFLHILREPKFFKKLEKDNFSNKYLANFYWLCKEFYERYKEIPFDVDNPELDQVREVLLTEKKYCSLETDLTDEKNMSVFLSNCQTILNNNYKKYNPARVEESLKAWVNWENFQNNFVRASEYMKTKNVTPDNVLDVIQGAQNILYSFSAVEENEEYAKDFFETETHQVDTTAVEAYPTGWIPFDTAQNKDGGGVKLGNLTIFVGAPNIGKTIVLQNVTKQLVLNGSNVLVVSLEMDEHDLAERISINMFNMSFDDYRLHRNDMSNIITDFSKKIQETTIPMGKLLLKRMYAPTPRELDMAVKMEEKERGIKINVVVLDYLTEMGNDEGIVMNSAFNTYMYHKTNTRNIYVNSGKGRYSVITAHQSSQIDPENGDMTLGDLSESKGIMHSPDTLVGIIQTTTQKSMNEYYFKYLKTRHSGLKDHYTKLTIDYSHMRLTCGALLSRDEYSSIDGSLTSDKIKQMSMGSKRT